MHATGTFDVKITPADVSEPGKAGGLGRMTIDKVWLGGIEGTSKGEMLTGITPDTGSMAYVAMERVNATVNGRQGTFYFTHKATMMKGDAASGAMDVIVVPQSGTGQLTGLTGTLKIDITGNVHHYDLHYELP